MAIPSEPIVFMKATTCISGPNDDVIQPKNSTKLDWEVELGIVIGSKAQYVSEAEALDYVAGYCVVNDVSERSFQLATGQWDKGKGFDTAGPIGPWLVTTDEIKDPQNLDMFLDLNGKRMQSGNTKTMIFGCAKIVSHVSQYMTLLPGDVICTGTPPGVGMGVKKDGKPAPVLDGLTGDQRFFLGWAQVWREKIRDAALQQQLATDPHSPGEARAALNLRNVDAWYSAFDVKPGDKGYVAPEDRARIW